MEEFKVLTLWLGRTGRPTHDASRFNSDKEEAVVTRVPGAPGAFHFRASQRRFGFNCFHTNNLPCPATEKTTRHFRELGTFSKTL
jgi:hypothetical protein